MCGKLGYTLHDGHLLSNKEIVMSRRLRRNRLFGPWRIVQPYPWQLGGQGPYDIHCKETFVSRQILHSDARQKLDSLEDQRGYIRAWEREYGPDDAVVAAIRCGYCDSLGLSEFPRDTSD